jgi:hypothetical protein
MFYELLTLDRLPSAPGIPAALAGATLKAAQEEGPVPDDVLGLLRRLLLVEQPFATAAEFNATLERVLYDGDYSPTTFNLAFLMHTLFREESERDAQAIKADQGTHFAQAPAPVEAAAGASKPGGGRTLNLLLGSGVVLALCGVGGMFYLSQQKDRQHQLEQQSMQAKLAAFQQAKEAADAKDAELAKQQEAQKALEAMFGKQAEEGATQEARAAAKRDLEAARQKTKDLARQRAEVAKEKQRLIYQAPAGPMPVPQGPLVQAPAPAPAQPAADAAPALVQKSPAQAPLGVNKETLPAAVQQASSIRVSVNVFVDPTGRPVKVLIKKGVDGNFGYNDAAQNAALASTFTPGAKGGKPAAGWVSMDYDFAKPK